MQNKPNFQKAKMNVNIYYTKVYNNETAFRRAQNKPNSNPINANQSQNKPNSNSIAERAKLMQSVHIKMIMKNLFRWRRKNKPKRTQFHIPRSVSIKIVEISECL